MKKYDYGVSIIFIIIGSGMIYMTRGFPFIGLNDIGAGFWPRVVGSLFIVLSLALIINTSFSKNKNDAEIIIDFRSDGMKRVIKMLIILIFYSIVTHYFGFYIGIAFMVPASAYLLGVKNKIKLVVLTFSIVAFVYIVFGILLQLRLPTGLLF